MKIIIVYILILNLLNAHGTKLEKLIPKNFEVVYKAQGDFNHDGIGDLLLTLENKKDHRLIIIKGEKHNLYSIFLDSTKILKLPLTNGQGYMVRNIYADFSKNNIIINIAEYQGKNINRVFYFKFKHNDFYLNKYVESIGTICNNYTYIKSFINNINEKLAIEDFSIDSFFQKYYNSKNFQKKFHRQILTSFKVDYKELLKLFKEKNKYLLKQYVEKNLLVYSDNDKLCKNYSYLDKYLYFNKPETIAISNDVAFFIGEAGYYEEASYLLEKIIKKFPNRTVAYYNLGDAYWALGKKQKAIKAYTTYIEQMCDKGLQNKIPKVVLERVSNKK